MAEYSPYQKKLIERYYDRRDDILLSRLGEIVTELYLAGSDSARKSLWSRADKAMKGLKVADSIRQHILNQKKPQLLAEHLRDWQKGIAGR